MYRQKKLSDDFIIKTIEKAAGKIPQSLLEDFFSITVKVIGRHYFTKSSESNLLRIIQNQFDIAFFINECVKFPHQVEILVTLANNSNYLTDILVRNPEYFHWIINPSVLEFNLDEKYFKDSLVKSVLAFKSFESKINVLRNFKRKEILRIGLKDIYLKEDLRKTTLHLSRLANAISSVLFDLCFQHIKEKHNLTNISGKFVLFSLGKLGGNELNYSSDIDLVAFYDKNTFINKKIYFQQILTETILLFIETASKKTGSGFLYRVDFRLRPDGRNAPLCGSYNEYLRYYEIRGEDWERQMLIKANFLCGNRSLFESFQKYLTRFIFPASFIVSPTEQIRRLKQNIEKQNLSEENIKLSAGGIRDIEFSIQALQLLNGGKHNDLRSGNSLEVINILQLKNILNREEAKIFTSAYYLYRKCEHYLQLMNDQQTHDIPVNGELAEKLAHFAGSDNLTAFRQVLNNSKKEVQRVYESILGSETENKNTKAANQINFADSKRAKSNLEFLRTGKSILEKKQFDSRTISAFSNIDENLLNFLQNSVYPDLILENFVRIVKTARYPRIWYEEFSDNKFFEFTLKLCEKNQKAIDIFAEDRLLRDEYLSRECLVLLNDNNITDLTLKQFYFRSSIQITAEILAVENFPSLYSRFLDYKIRKSVKDYIVTQEFYDSFFIAAMGSYGAQELSFASDIDLIFLSKEIKTDSTIQKDIQKDFQKLLSVIKESLVGLEIDCRLRPEGKNSQLVWDFENYIRYFKDRARTWEFQSFVKCRFIIGDQLLFNNFVNQFNGIVKLKDLQIIKSEMVEMRKKLLPINDSSINIKKSYGGLYDIDFIKSYLRISGYDLKRFNINPAQLDQNFNFLKKAELMNQNIFNTKLPKIPTEEIKLLKIAKAFGFENEKIFLKKLHDVLHQNRIFFQSTFN